MRVERERLDSALEPYLGRYRGAWWVRAFGEDWGELFRMQVRQRTGPPGVWLGGRAGRLRG